MRLRPSMKKFLVHEDDEADIEIARAFDHPNASYLNRFLYMYRSHLCYELKTSFQTRDNGIGGQRSSQKHLHGSPGKIEGFYIHGHGFTG